MQRILLRCTRLSRPHYLCFVERSVVSLPFINHRSNSFKNHNMKLNRPVYKNIYRFNSNANDSDSENPDGTIKDVDTLILKPTRAFGEDTGPKLDLETKLKNQERVANKVKTSYRSVQWAIAGNSSITCIKFIAAAATGSPVLLSEAIHTYVFLHLYF